ncbi:hypothetical protein Q5762_11055 [Streptomyces sp. P9(2023)]|uniref:hypothetical protein n=1 Tax=Streptomyces sp. P9(2023) TaxID=3064394 RepID=UPI0028F3FDFB|nr:hypothetical protein [Streptomyces sp. P9(2023)]MDT9688880.1 hypothetical protein [Streptomyces sp. P9(2023)]
MLLLGLLLLGATGAFIGLLIADNTGGPEYTVVQAIAAELRQRGADSPLPIH